MRRSKLVVLLIGIVFLLSGCDWARKELGMPVSADLQLARQKIKSAQESLAKMNASRQHILDSLAASADTLSSGTDSLKASTGNQAKSQPSAQGRFHVVVGSFKDSTNCKKMTSMLVKHGYKPSLIKLRNGYTLVSAASFNNQGDANKEMMKILDTDYAPDDVWVYDNKK